MELPKDESIEDAVKHQKRTTKEESMDRVTTVEDAVSGVDDQTKLTGDDMILGILKTQANQIQALTTVVAQHGRVLELLTSLNVPSASCEKLIIDLNLNSDPNGGMDIYPGDGTQKPPVKEVGHTRTLPSEAPTRQECPPPKPNDVV
ncbi:hypothetical protein S245_055369 [Arachis hypogaea]